MEIIDLPSLLVRISRRTIPVPEPHSLSCHIEVENESIIASSADLGVVAKAAGQNVGGVVAGNEVVARTALRILDDDAVGDRKAAINATRVGRNAAAARRVKEGRSAQVDRDIERSRIDDLIDAAGVPDASPIRAWSVAAGKRVGVVARVV